MPEIIWDSSEKPKWLPALNKILMSDEPYFREKGPMVMAHEIGHWRYDQTLGDTDPLIDMYQERDAWRYALSKLPPEEIDLNFLEYGLLSYVDDVEDWYGKGSQEVDLARKLRYEIMGLARSKKGVF